MSAFLSRVDIINDDETRVPPLLKLTVTEEFEAFDTGRDLHAQEYLYGLRHDSVEDRAQYLQYMISMLVRTLEAEYAIDVDGMVLTEPEMLNLLNRYDKREESQ